MIAHTSQADIQLSGSSELRAFIFSENRLLMSGSAAIRGAVVVKDLIMRDRAVIVGDTRSCSGQDEYELTISPGIGYGLTCESIPVQFTVLKNGVRDTGFVGNISILSSPSGLNDDVCFSATSNGPCQSNLDFVPISGGNMTLYLQSLLVGDVQVAASVRAPSNQLLVTESGPYRFAPFGFRIHRDRAIQMIAGREEEVVIEAVASQGAQCDVIEDYGGETGEEMLIRFSALDYVRPDTGTQPVFVNQTPFNASVQSILPIRFTNGSARVSVRYPDAGEVSFGISDRNWRPEFCDANDTNCVNFREDWPGLVGTAVISSRPYTFAMCDIHSASSTDHTGTASTGPGFVAAGESFSVTFKPVIWTDELAAPLQDSSKDGRPDIEATRHADPRWCTVPTTPNYYSVTGLPAPIRLSIPAEPASPVGDGGVGGALNGSLNSEFQAAIQARQGLQINNLSWSEVGSLWLQADADYLGMAIVQGVGEIGRFYPHHFAITASTVVDAYDDFTYMDQPFLWRATVEAQNTRNAPTRNYGLFDRRFQESLVLQAIDAAASGGAANALTNRLSEQVHEQPWRQATQQIGQNSLRFLRLLRQAIPKATSPDGPYRVQLGLTVDGRADCATRGCSDFNSKTMAIRHQNGATPELAAPLSGNIHARYGRMRLEDSVGREGALINIPVILEYWQDGQFVVNGDDSDSRFEGQHYFRQGITHAESTAFTASDGVKMVVSGDSQPGDLYATGAAVREQVRFWQKLVAETPAAIAGENAIKDSSAGTQVGAVSQPWLLYDWRGQGDENPSAVVTFGLYRGNDRIIYRGERNINQALSE
ncbi:hypothetical protein KDD30_13860 [Photobacterium sp. GJ3]|uniref:DUF6701 domain-containing protein n=1 Tax=Photobacterium sp. GJ3 TaxID=2829502 RepID=UPI001B8C8FBD|nr:DUF6701 domain-containing protein [Photobacterium sp. GJ3]QUJ67135.1 hypothetical protein KDD30_13860 [Photobacterium sp. GJ3]